MVMQQFGESVEVEDLKGSPTALAAPTRSRVVDVPVRNLEHIVGGSVFSNWGTMARACHRWARQNGYLSGYWNGEQANYPDGAGHVVGVVLIAA